MNRDRKTSNGIPQKKIRRSQLILAESLGFTFISEGSALG
jgi:hypothetical protein